LKKLIIHAGHYKTGSSFLQNCFYRNKQLLLSQGVLFPRQGLDFSSTVGICHRLLAYADDPSFDKLLSKIKLESEIHEHHTLLLSAEAFCQPFFLNRIHIFEEVFDNYDITFNIILRSQDELVASLYKEWIQAFRYNGGIRNLLEEWEPILNFHKLIDNIVSTTEQLGINISIYNNYENGPAYFDGVSTWLGLPLVNYDIEEVSHNPSISLISAEVIKKLRIKYKNKIDDVKIYTLIDELIKGNRYLASFSGVPKDIWEILALKYSDGNNLLESEYGLPLGSLSLQRSSILAVSDKLFLLNIDAVSDVIEGQI